MKVNITDVIPPTQRQKESGIHGTVNITIEHDGVEIAKLSGLTVRQSKRGDKFLSEPSYSVDGKDGKKYYKHFMLYPSAQGEEGQSQRDSKDAVAAEVLRILEAGGTRRKESKGAATSAASAAPPSDPWSSK